MTDFEYNFVELLKTDDVQDQKQAKATPIEQQLSLAEGYISEKLTKCARLSLFIIYELLRESTDEKLKERYNKAVDLFKAL